MLLEGIFNLSGFARCNKPDRESARLSLAPALRPCRQSLAMAGPEIKTMRWRYRHRKKAATHPRRRSISGNFQVLTLSLAADALPADRENGILNEQDEMSDDQIHPSQNAREQHLLHQRRRGQIRSTKYAAGRPMHDSVFRRRPGDDRRIRGQFCC
jgi:hypothetical protein